MIEEDENGIASVSTSLWGRDVTGGENSGQVGREVREDTREKRKDKQESSSDGGGLSTGSNNSLGSKFPALFGQIGYGGLNQEKSINGMDGDSDEVGLLESIIPVWGSIKLARQNFRKGETGWGIFYSVMAVSDVFLIKSLAIGGVRAIGGTLWKTGSNSWGATRSWMGRRGLAKPGQEVHHWLFQQRGKIGERVPNRLKNQPWNLKNMPSDTRIHDAIHGGGGFANRRIPYLLWYGTPDYIKGSVSNFGGSFINELRKE